MGNDNSRRIAYIMRGLPGSGKSTTAKELVGEFGAIHSTDSYFYLEDGEYRFDTSRLEEYHERNFKAFCQSLDDGFPVVICDNTNIKREHYERYAEAASLAGYMVMFVAMPHPTADVAAGRSVHNVPASIVERMISDWED